LLWLKLGWRNLWRNKRRTFIQLAAISGAVFLAIWFHNLQIGMYADMIDEGTRLGSGHIGVYRTGYLAERKTELLIDGGAVLKAVEGHPEVEGVFPRLHVPGLARSARASRGVVAMGVEFEREAALNPLLDKRRVSAGRLPKNDREALMGKELAQELGLQLRKKFVWMGQDADGEIVSKLYRVCGLLDTGVRDVDARLLLVRRQGLSRIIGRDDAAHEVAMILKDHRRIEAVYPAIKEAAAGVPGAEALTWKEAMPELHDMIQFDNVGGLIIYAFLFLLVGIGTVNTLLMSVVERKREFGVLRAVGLEPAGVTKMVMSEALVLSILGTAGGWVLAILAGIYTASHGIDFTSLMKSYEAGGTLIEPILYSGWDWPMAAAMSAVMVSITLLSAWYPSKRVVKTPPAEAMRSY